MPWKSGGSDNDPGNGGGANDGGHESGQGGGQDGGSPWGKPASGSQGGGSGGASGNGGGNGKEGGGRDPFRPRPSKPELIRSPWTGNGGPPRGRGGGGNSGLPPELEAMVERIQDSLRGVLPSFLGGSGGGLGGGLGGRRRGTFSGGRGLAFVAAILLVVWLGSGFYRVQPDEQGVVLRFGAYDRTALPGLNYHIPWPVESVLLPAVTRVNRVEVGYRSSVDTRGLPGRDVSTREEPEESLMLTGDENIIDIDCAIFWRIRDAGSYLFNTRNPNYTVKSAAESVLREVIGRTPIQPALTDARQRIETDVRRGVQAIADQYGMGVEITQVQLQKVDPPAAVIESFRDVQRANTDAERMRNEAESYRNDIVPRARGDAARVVAEAEGQKQSAVVQAGGEAQRFLSVLKAYEASKDVTLQRIYIETMERVLRETPTVVVDDKLQGIVPYLPLVPGGDLGARPPVPNAGQGASQSAPASGSNPPSAAGAGGSRP